MILGKYFMASIREIFAGIRSCFSLSAGERLVVLLAIALFLLALAMRWRLLAGERPEPREQAVGGAPITP